MSEEIIIDGLNVAECEHCMYKGFKAFPQCKLNLDSFATACQQHKDCTFKQLKRLQAENEELKAENEQMKKSFVSHSEFMNILENNPNINWEETAKENIYLINKYCKALEEIRNHCDNYARTEDYVICETFNEFLELIFNEISEVLK